MNSLTYIFPIFLLFLGLANPLPAQINWLNYTTDDRNPNLVFQGDLVWFSNHGGLTRLNRTTGEKFVYTAANSDLPSNRISEMKQDPNGNLWLLAFEFLCKFDGTDFLLAEPVLPPGETIAGFSHLHISESGNVFVKATYSQGNSSQKIIAKIDPNGDFSVHLPEVPSFTTIFIENDTVTWVEQPNDDILRIAGQDTTAIFNTAISTLPNPTTHAILKDSEGNIYVMQSPFIIGSEHDFYLFKYANDTWENIHLGTLFGTPFFTISNALFDEEDVFWSSIQGNTAKLLFRFDGQASETLASPLFDIDGKNHELLNISSDGHWWLYLQNYHGNRLYEYDGNTLAKRNVSISDFQENQISKIEFDFDGNIWVQTSEGVSSFDGVSWTNHRNQLDPVLLNQIRYMKAAPDGTIWLSAAPNTAPGYCLARFNGLTWEYISFGLAGSFYIDVNRFDFDAQGNIWATSSYGLYKYDGVNLTLFNSNNSNLPSNIFDVEVTESGEVWVAGNTGLFLFDGTDFVKHPDFPGSILILDEDSDGNLWANNQTALGRYDGNEIIWFDETNSPLDPILDVPLALDENGIYWFATREGLYEYDGVEWVLYNEGISEDIPHDMKMDEYGNKWIATMLGLTVFNEHGIREIGGKARECLTGNVFLDVDGNGEPSNQEAGLPLQKVTLQPDSTTFFSSLSGKYKFDVEVGTQYQVELEFEPNDWLLTSDSAAYSVLATEGCVEDLDFGLQSVQTEESVRILITPGLPRCFAKVPVWANVKNTSFQPLSGNFEIQLDAQMSFLEATPTPSEIAGNTLIWNFTGLPPFQEIGIFMKIQYPGTFALGDTLRIQAKLFSNGNPPSLNEVETEQILRCSFDPNDKQAASTGENQDSLSLFEDALDYLIRFENTGNDTAFNVVIRDTLSANLDLETFEVLAASHPIEVTIRGRAVEFRFPDIFLLWTDADSLLSQGFVRYRIHPKADLPDPTLIENTAYIYFDFNPPIITNTTQNVLVKDFPTTPVGENFLSKNDCLATISPNPFEFSTTFRFAEAVQYGNFILFDAQGHKILHRRFSGKEMTIKRENLAVGVYFYQLTGDLVCSGKLLIQ